MTNYRFDCLDCGARATTERCKTCLRKRRHGEYRIEVVVEIQRLADEHGFPPTSREVGGRLRGRAKLAFGSWGAAVEAAGYAPRKPGESKPPSAYLGAPDRLPLTTNQGREVVGWTQVDPEDRAHLTGRCWFRGSDGYVYGKDPRNRSNIALHRFLLDPDRLDPRDLDHINGDRLDNRRSNLRFATRSENLQNRTAPSTGRSRFRGVHWHEEQKRWAAVGSVENTTHRVGHFADELDAAVAIQQWRDEHMPFAQPDPELVAALRWWPEVTA